MLNDFAVGPLVLDFTNSALERKPAGGSAPTRLVASITVLPLIRWSLSNAPTIAPYGTASSTASASETSPPSRPSRVTWWPARSQRSASPPPTWPLPNTEIFICASFFLLSSSSYDCFNTYPFAFGVGPRPGRLTLPFWTRSRIAVHRRYPQWVLK